MLADSPPSFFPFYIYPINFWHGKYISILKKYYLGFYKFSRAVIGLPWWLSGKEFDCQAEDAGLIPGSGRSLGGRHDNPLQYSSWEIPWTEEPGRLESMGSQRVRHDLVTKQQQRTIITTFKKFPLSREISKTKLKCSLCYPKSCGDQQKGCQLLTLPN